MIKHIISCDADGCSASAEIPSDSAHDIEDAEYLPHAWRLNFHYCPNCRTKEEKANG